MAGAAPTNFDSTRPQPLPSCGALYFRKHKVKLTDETSAHAPRSLKSAIPHSRDSGENVVQKVPRTYIRYLWYTSPPLPSA